MTDLSPSSYVDLANRFIEDSKLASDFGRRMGRHLTSGNCDSNCMKSMQCDGLHFDPYLNAECKGNPVFDWTGSFMDSLRRALQEPWLKPIKTNNSMHAQT